MKIAWVTDPHIDFCSDKVLNKFYSDIRTSGVDAVFLTGDISNNLEKHMHKIPENIHVPIYSVLGNHDFYGSSFSATRKAMTALTKQYSHLIYLTDRYIGELVSNIGIIGMDGWYDGRYGEQNSDIGLLDFSTINDLKHINYFRKLIFEKLAQLGDDVVSYFRDVLPRAFEQYDTVYLLTHVPPWEELCVYHGKRSDPQYLPFFSCKALGDFLRTEMCKRPEKRLVVLAGHTHGEKEAKILPNLYAKVGRAFYEKIFIEIIDIEELLPK